MKLPIEKDRLHPMCRPKTIQWTACQPFVSNSRGVLVHRPRFVTTYTHWKYPYIAMTAWCGHSANGTKKFTFLDAPAADDLLCARCEEKATAAGMPSADSLAGRHVHIGGVVPMRQCCAQGEA